jgi:diketogulonate reductase-like aldo/keto reductase
MMKTQAVPTITLPARRDAPAQTIPKLGQGTWEMGERRARRDDEIAALRTGIELGMTVIDTAEMYGEGATERWLGDALDGLRDEVFLVSKVYPHNASKRGVQEACERSLKRLRTDRLDLYLLHWRGTVPLESTIAGFDALLRAGKIRRWGVSNFDVDDMEALFALEGGDQCSTNQILYNVGRRGPEFDLLPWLVQHGMPAMAYSPVDHARLPAGGVLDAIAKARGVSAFQVALAWVLARDEVFAIPKAASVEHVRENYAAIASQLDDMERAAIDREFPPPARKRALEML